LENIKFVWLLLRISEIPGSPHALNIIYITVVTCYASALIFIRTCISLIYDRIHVLPDNRHNSNNIYSSKRKRIYRWIRVRYMRKKNIRKLKWIPVLLKLHDALRTSTCIHYARLLYFNILKPVICMQTVCVC